MLPLLISLSLAAQEPSNPDTESRVTAPLEQVTVTATRRTEDARDLPAPIGGLDEDTLRSLGADVVAGALRGQPGVFFQQTTPGQGIPIVRGLKGSQLLHLVDGMRLNNAFFRDAPNQYLGLVKDEMTRAYDRAMRKIVQREKRSEKPAKRAA